MTDAMFTTTTGEALGERLFRHYLATSIRDAWGVRVSVAELEERHADAAAAVWTDALAAGPETLLEMLATYTRLVTGQRVIDAAETVATRRYLGCDRDCASCGGAGCAA